MKKKIFVRGPMLSQSGYGEQARFALRALRSREDIFDIHLQPIRWGETGWIWEDNEFSFYLVVGVGQYTASGPSYQGKAQIESLESLLVAIASVAKGQTTLVVDEKATKAAAAAKVFFTLYKGDVGILTVELRYGGNFKSYPRFHANMHPDFLKRIGQAKIQVLQPLGM